MERFSARDDAPWPVRGREPQRESSAAFWLTLALILVLIGGGAAFYYFNLRYEEPPYIRAAQDPERSPPAASEATPAPQASAEPVLRLPETAPEERSVPLPTLDNSDPMMRDALSGLIGRQPFEQFVYPAELVRRIVATVDNLPRKTAPRRVMPLEPVPGRFAVAGPEDDTAISPANWSRYAPYVRVFESLDSRALVQRYVDAYPLFQRAYRELGYPDSYFNTRLLAAIDDLLAAPEVEGAIQLTRPKVLYEFADPDLESRSAGQKIMLRIGPDNAKRVKAKLREIRRELVAAAQRQR